MSLFKVPLFGESLFGESLPWPSWQDSLGGVVGLGLIL